MQKIINFTIRGNQEDTEGDPIPYTHIVSRSLWLPYAQRYSAWKNFVRATFGQLYPEFMPTPNEEIWGEGHPFTTRPSMRARMDIKIFWVNLLHADPHNIFKGIADPLFRDDKFLDGSFESVHAENGMGRVEVQITLTSFAE